MFDRFGEYDSAAEIRMKLNGAAGLVGDLIRCLDIEAEEMND